MGGRTTISYSTRLLEDLKTEAAEGTAEEKTPYFRVLQTSSSHEPFEVPFRRLENDRLRTPLPIRIVVQAIL